LVHRSKYALNIDLIEIIKQTGNSFGSGGLSASMFVGVVGAFE
jgi:hypothetical protein